MSNQACTNCSALLQVTLQAIFESWEDEDKNRHFPVECPHRHAGCRPVIVHDGGNGRRRHDLSLSM